MQEPDGRPELERELDKRCAQLLTTQPDWIHRRVESISFLNEGQTRRQISFDFTLSPKLRVWWDYSDSGNFSADIPNGEAEGRGQIAVPLTFMRKGALVDFDLEDANGTRLPSVGKTANGEFELRALMDRAARLGWDPSRGSAIHEGAYCLIHSVVDRNTYSQSAYPEVLDQSRLEYCKKLILALWYGEAPGLPDFVDDESPHVKDMFGQLSEKVEQVAESDRESLLQLLTFLAAAIDSFVLIALIPEESVRLRTIVKVRFNSPRGDEQENGGLERLKKWFRGPEPLGQQVAFPALNASTSHIEIASPDEADLGVPDLQCTCGDNPTAETADPSSRFFTPSGKTKHKQMCPSHEVYIARTHSRTHLSVTKHANLPFVRFNVDLRVPLYRLVTTVAWCLTMVVINILCLVALVSKDDRFQKFFTADNVFALVTLLVAIAGFLWFTAARHPVTRELFFPLNRAVLGSLAAVTLSLLLLAFSTDESGRLLSSSSPISVVAVILVAGATAWTLWEFVRTVVAAARSVRVRKTEAAAGGLMDDHAEVAALAVLEEFKARPALVRAVLRPSEGANGDGD